MDLPFALARWVSANGVTHPAASSHRSEKFGHHYGVLIKEWRALQRAIFVIDGEGTITYVEYVLDQDHEPDYDAAVGRRAGGAQSTHGRACLTTSLPATSTLNSTSMAKPGVFSAR